MPDKFFLDTNIIIYSFDSNDPLKQLISQQLIKNALSHKIGIISYQVIQEFLNVAVQSILSFKRRFFLRESFGNPAAPRHLPTLTLLRAKPASTQNSKPKTQN